MKPRTAIQILENAGKYLVSSRKLAAEIRLTNPTAIQSAKHHNPDFQALTVISICLARVVNVRDDGWVKQACTILQLQERA